jgi:hypothetical protein
MAGSNLVTYSLLIVQGIATDLCDEPARGDHAHGGEGQVQEVPGGGEEAIQSGTAEVSFSHFLNIYLLNMTYSKVVFNKNMLQCFFP